MIKISPSLTPKYEFIGKKKTPIIIIDDYVEQPQNLIQYAQQESEFTVDNQTQYPGVRAHIPKPIVVDYLQPLMTGLYHVFNIDKAFKSEPKDNYFSLITTPESELTEVQSMPHFDTNDPNTIAIIHYIGNGDFGGIGFFKHKKTGYEYIDYSCRDSFLQQSQQAVNNKTSDIHYCTEQNEEFECYKTILYKANRLIAFPGYLLHSSLVKPETDINNDPSTGRLTANMFVQFK